MSSSGICYRYSLNIFDEYAERLHISIGEVMRRYKNVIISGDFNAASMAWGGTKTDKRGRMLSEVQDRNHLASIRFGKCIALQNGTRRSFLDIIVVNGSLFKRRKRIIAPRITGTFYKNSRNWLYPGVGGLLGIRLRT